jgi:hypothetical protein
MNKDFSGYIRGAKIRLLDASPDRGKTGVILGSAYKPIDNGCWIFYNLDGSNVEQFTWAGDMELI